MGLRENLWRHPISQLSLRKALTVSPAMPVRQAVELMRREKIGAVIAINEAGKPTGMFNEKLLIRLLAYRPEAADEPIGSHLSVRIVCLRRDEPIARLIDVMQKHSLRWVCVVDEEGRAVALTGLRGVMEYVIDYFPRLVKVQPIEAKLSMEHREGA
jgi:CBS domain-containing protein